MRMTEEEFAQLKNVRVAKNSCFQLDTKNARGTIGENQIVDRLAGLDKPIPKRGDPNKTEAEYGRLLQLEFSGSRVVFEAMTLRMANGHRYTPDWVVMGSGGILCVEVKAVGKNGYKHPSYQRAKVAFDQCRVEFPWFCWRWAEKVNGIWEVKTYAL